MGREFPLQRPLSSSDVKPGPSTIPWEIAERAYAEYAKRYGTSQSLERLAERGGFGVGEMDMLLPSWRDEIDVFVRLKREIAETVGACHERVVFETKLRATKVVRARQDALEEAANVCDSMVVGGRAWTHDQEVAANALFAAAKEIRARTGSDTVEPVDNSPGSKPTDGGYEVTVGEAERNMIEPADWEGHFYLLPDEIAQLLRSELAAPTVPVGLALVPGAGYCVLVTGQGPAFQWKEWE